MTQVRSALTEEETLQVLSGDREAFQPLAIALFFISFPTAEGRSSKKPLPRHRQKRQSR